MVGISELPPVHLDLTGAVPVEVPVEQIPEPQLSVIRAPNPQLNQIIIPVTVGLAFFLVASQL